MKTKVTAVKTTYYTNLEKKIVVCVMECNIDLLRMGNTHIAINPRLLKNLNIDWEGDFTVRGVAKCNSNDEFNLQTGQRIAQSKAKIKALYVASRAWEIISEHLAKASRFCYLRFNVCEGEAYREEIHLSKLTE